MPPVIRLTRGRHNESLQGIKQRHTSTVESRISFHDKRCTLKVALVLLFFSNSWTLVHTFQTVVTPQQQTLSKCACVRSLWKDFHHNVLAASREPEDGVKPTRKKAGKPARFTQTLYNSSSKKKTAMTAPLLQTTSPPSPSAAGKMNKDRMWRQNGQSIDELEAKLMTRWGTDLSQWTASDGDYDDDDDDDAGTDVSAAFRAKPVVDPWAVKETKLSEKSSQSDTKSSPQQSHPLAAFKQSPQGGVKDITKSPLSAFGTSLSNPAPRINLQHLIADEPAGGRGTNNNNNSNSQRMILKPLPIDKENEEPGKKVRAPVAESIPVLDNNGRRIYLTTAQAERFFGDVTTAAAAAGSETLSQNNDDETKEPSMSWTDLGISDSTLLHNLHDMGCASPVAVQRNSCPSIMSGQDVVVGTYTGSGKTLAFLIPTLQRLFTTTANDDSPSKGTVRVLIVAPGRELASQIASVARAVLVNKTETTVMLAIGGTTFARNLEQIRKRKPSILVGTPGRIAELVVGRAGEKRGRLHMKNLQTVILDEFDALLEYKPHSDPTNAIMESLKRTRGTSFQSILCSATASDMLSKKKNLLLEEKYLRPGYVLAMAEKDDMLVTAAGQGNLGGGGTLTTRVSRTVIHGVVHVPHRRFALETLRRILHTEPLPQQILIFVSDPRKADLVVEKLADMGIIAAPLHGGMGSEKMDRTEVSKALREGYVGIVVATEMAARGLDAPLLTHVINMDLPTDVSHYAHRAGRCGRGGRPGVVINMTTSPQERAVPGKFADNLGIAMHTVEVRNAKLNIVDPESQDLDMF